MFILCVGVSRKWFVSARVRLHVSTPSFGHGSEPVIVMREPLDDLIG